HAVSGQALRVRGTQYRVQQPEQLHGFVRLTQGGTSPNGPGRGMGVLAAVLPDSWGITLDVPRIVPALVERRRQEQDQAILLSHQALTRRRHCPTGPLGRPLAADYRPCLGDQVDPALVAVHRADRGAIAVVGAPVPCSVPAFLFSGL